jgi:5-(carboxyamino)imidazole ribonucleotide synthase
MYNILGSKDFEGEYKPIEVQDENVFLKMYGKKISKPSRKLGHLNLVGNQGESVEQLLQKLDHIKKEIQITELT